MPWKSAAWEITSAKGSGQAIFVGLADEHYMPTSEVYGFVEETAHYLKLDGEAIANSSRGQSQGQIFILDQASSGGLDGIQAMYYDGTPIVINAKDINHTEITSRDTDRQGFPHFSLKEISESATSVEKTLQNRWKIKDDGNDQHAIVLDQAIIPKSLEKALGSGEIKRIFFIGQGTAGVAALACANILNYYLDDPGMLIGALKASEFSGFQLNEHDAANSMADALVIAISQSGTITDTNRTLDMVKERGAYTLAIVNRRDKDTAILKAHKATPVVIADQGEKRFDPYAEAVFQVPVVKEHLAPILNTLVGHFWGYYAALAINDSSRFLYTFREDIRTTIDKYAGNGLDVYEISAEQN
ncbi:MAG: hypothetical protein KJP23_06940 [Deltaproteobacteria bacterium]|nr:hypothetical protein [Deltaproteobacteria bacterium]